MSKALSILAKILLVLMFVMMALDGLYKGRNKLNDDEPHTGINQPSASPAYLQSRDPRTHRYTGN
jgi:hypothetical protein